MKRKVFRSVRITIYCAMIINGLFVQYTNLFHYVCDYSTFSCPFCGMRNAINLLLMGKFELAYESNKLILLVVIISVLMMIDTIFIIYKYFKNN